MSAKHTPGPWCADRDFVYPALPVTAVNRFYAIVHGAHTGADELAANARLMAAAPELLAEAERVLPILEALEASGEWDTFAAGTGIATPNGLRAAIAKAEGAE